jgi:hypothetical protein
MEIGRRLAQHSRRLHQRHGQNKDVHRSTSGNWLPGGENLSGDLPSGITLFDWQAEDGTHPVPSYTEEARLPGQ